MKMFCSRKKGFGIVEALVGAAIISASLLALSTVVRQFAALSADNHNRTRASYIAQEGMEAVRFIRDLNWQNIADLATDTPYGVEFVNNTWVATTTVSFVDSVFYRTFLVSPVSRDLLGAIVVSGGAVDQGTKKINVVVAWSDRGATTTATTTTYLTSLF